MNKEPARCPTCNQVVENRVIPIIDVMVISLFRVYKWCYENKRIYFKRSEIDHLLGSGSMYARFGDLVHFGGVLFKKNKGHWGINHERARLFFENKYQIPSTVTIDRKTRIILEYGEPIFFRDVPFLHEFLNDEYQFIPQYEPTK